MSRPNDGGSAFPTGISTPRDEEFQFASTGLSVRDWFAGQALVVVAQFGAVRKYADRMDESPEGLAGNVARWAYEIADAMLVARKV